MKEGRAQSPIPAASAGKEAVVEAAVAHVFAQMDQDRKTTALKSLQVDSRMTCPKRPVSAPASPCNGFSPCFIVREERAKRTKKK